MVLSVAWSFGIQLVVFFCSNILVVLLHTLGILQVAQYVSADSSSLTHYRPYIIRDLFVPYVDSLVRKETFMRTKSLEPLQKLRARVWIQ